MSFTFAFSSPTVLSYTEHTVLTMAAALEAAAVVGHNLLRNREP
jgi:hypothetical protein